MLCASSFISLVREIISEHLLYWMSILETSFYLNLTKSCNVDLIILDEDTWSFRTECIQGHITENRSTPSDAPLLD